MNAQIKLLADQCYYINTYTDIEMFNEEKFAELIIESTLNQVDEQVYGRGENSWYYDDDKKRIRLHFGYGELK